MASPCRWAGSSRFNTSTVSAMAKTPSLSASNRPLSCGPSNAPPPEASSPSRLTSVLALGDLAVGVIGGDVELQLGDRGEHELAERAAVGLDHADSLAAAGPRGALPGAARRPGG